MECYIPASSRFLTTDVAVLAAPDCVRRAGVVDPRDGVVDGRLLHSQLREPTHVHTVRPENAPDALFRVPTVVQV